MYLLQAQIQGLGGISTCVGDNLTQPATVTLVREVYTSYCSAVFTPINIVHKHFVLANCTEGGPTLSSPPNDTATCLHLYYYTTTTLNKSLLTHYYEQ